MAMIFHTTRAARSQNPLNSADSKPIYNCIFDDTNRPKRVKYLTRDNQTKHTSSLQTFRQRWRDKSKTNCNPQSILNLTSKLHILKFIKNDDHPDYFSTLDEYVVENILKFLTYLDLLSLSKCSRNLLCKVQHFALHYVESHLRMEKLDKFLKSDLMTNEERIIKNRLIRDNGPQLSTSLMAFKYFNEYGQYFARSSITTAVVANRRSQFQKQRYIVRELCEPLGRDVLRLKQICGLHFQKQFSNVPAGQYQVSIHLQITVDLERSGRPRRWNNNCTVNLAVIHDDEPLSDRQPLASVNIEPQIWKIIQKDKFRNNFLNGNASITKEENHLNLSPYRTSDWFYVKLKPFELEHDNNNLSFVWTEKESTSWKNSGRWKEGMSWDFVQIQGV